MSSDGFVVLSLASPQHRVMQYQPIKQHSVIILTSIVEEYQRLSNHYIYQLLVQSADKDCLHVLFVTQPQKSDIVKNLQSPMYTFRAHRSVENHHILEYGAMQNPAHSITMFVHNASDWVTMRNIAVSANYENQLSLTNKVEEENHKLTQRRHSKSTKWHLFLISNIQLAEDSSLSDSTVVQPNSTAYGIAYDNHLGSLLIHSTQMMSICQWV